MKTKKHMTINSKNNSGVSRRKFILTTGAGLALFNILPGCALGGSKRLGPNEKLNVAGIGVGRQGGGDIGAVAGEGHKIVALCDVDHVYAAKTISKYPDAKLFTDYRIMLDKLDKDIDAVVIGTPDHTHAVIAMEAMRRGKHVYCEKPLAHSVHEVRALMAAAKKYKVVTQLGNQGHSYDSIRQVCEWVWADAIGPVHAVHAGCDQFTKVYSQIGNLEKLNQKYDPPPSLDYDLWTGPVPLRPYTPFWVHWNWRGWMPYGTGTIGDWFCHVLDPSFWSLNLDAPTTVLAEVADYDPVKQGLTYPPGTKITFEFPARQGRGPVKVVWYDGNMPVPRPEQFSAEDRTVSTGAIMFGSKGMLVHGSHGGTKCYISPDTLMDQYSGDKAPAQTLVRVKNHAWDWIEAIRTGRQAGSNFGYGGPLTQAALLGAIAIRFPGQKLQWDDVKARFTNHDAANAYVAPAYRKGWSL